MQNIFKNKGGFLMKKFEIKGSTVPSVEIHLSSSDSVFTQSGAMLWMSGNIKMETNTKGGLFKGLGRVISGESLFMTTYTAKQDAKISFASTVPGSIFPIDVSKSNYTIQKGAFLVAESSVNLSTIFRQKLGTAIFSKEGLVLQKLSGEGTAFLEVDGDAIELDLAPGEVIKVDAGGLVAFEETVDYNIEMVKGITNVMFGTEGLFLIKMTGPGKVIVQTLNIGELASKISQYIPVDTDN